jgi:hypothetical protein
VAGAKEISPVEEFYIWTRSAGDKGAAWHLIILSKDKTHTPERRKIKKCVATALFSLSAAAATIYRKRDSATNFLFMCHQKRA